MRMRGLRHLAVQPLWVVVSGMAGAALLWLSYQYWRLLWGEAAIWGSSPEGAVDLRIFHTLVRGWIAGEDVYTTRPTWAFYPPASHLLLWPFLGWLDVTAARYAWAITSGIALWWMARRLADQSRARTSAEWTFVFMLPVSSYAAGATIGNGQLGIHALAALLGGVLLLQQRPVTWRNDVVASLLMMLALVKPSLTAPFFWLVVFLPGRLRPAVLVVCGYLVLTWSAVGFQRVSLGHLVGAWLANASNESVVEGYADVARLLDLVGKTSWLPVVSIAILVAAGVWVYAHRSRDLWLLIGVLSLVSRFWAHHRWYDDLLVVCALAAAWRFRASISAHTGTVADVWLVLASLTLLAPGGLYLLPSPFNLLFVVVQVATWLALLFVLLWMARVDAGGVHDGARVTR